MSGKLELTRRELLHAMGIALVVPPMAGMGAFAMQVPFVEPPRVPYKGSDDALLDEIERAAFDFFWTETGTSGQFKDRALLNGHDTRMVASIAATGFGLAGLCIGDSREYGKNAEIGVRVT